MCKLTSLVARSVFSLLNGNLSFHPERCHSDDLAPCSVSHWLNPRRAPKIVSFRLLSFLVSTNKLLSYELLLKSTWLLQVDYSLEKNGLVAKLLANTGNLPGMNLSDVNINSVCLIVKRLLLFPEKVPFEHDAFHDKREIR